MRKLILILILFLALKKEAEFLCSIGKGNEMGLRIQTAMIVDDDDDLTYFAGKYFKDEEDECIVGT